MMMRARRLSVLCLIGGAHALSITRRSLAIGTAASAAATPIGALASPNYDGLYLVEGSKARRRIMNGVVEAEEDGRWRALESSADSDGLLVGGRVEIKFRRDASSTAWRCGSYTTRFSHHGRAVTQVAGKRGVFESARNSAVLDCMVQVTFPADSIRWSDGERWVRKRVLYPKT